MYEAYYNLSANPFRLAPDQKFFYESACHRRGLSYLRYGLHQSQGFVVVTGVPGTGKSLLVQTLFTELADRRMVIATLNNPNLCDLNILRAVANCFDVHYPEDNKAGLLGAIERFLINQRQLGKHVLLIVDEAQNLPKKSLEELRMLTNFQCKEQALIQIMLLGQQQLQKVLSDPSMEQLSQRIIASCHLAPLNAMDMRLYIEHRLGVVGWQGHPAFTVAALRLIHHHSRGIPRLINNLCDRLLLAASLDEKDEINREHVEVVMDELRSEASGAWRESSAPVDWSTAADLAPLPDGHFIPTAAKVQKVVVRPAESLIVPVAPTPAPAPALAVNGQTVVALSPVVDEQPLPKVDERPGDKRVVIPDFDTLDDEFSGSNKDGYAGKRKKKNYASHSPADLLDEATFKKRSKKHQQTSADAEGLDRVGSIVGLQAAAAVAKKETEVLVPCYEEPEDDAKVERGFFSLFKKDKSHESPAAPSVEYTTPEIKQVPEAAPAEGPSSPTVAEYKYEPLPVFLETEVDEEPVEPSQLNGKKNGRWWVMPTVAAILVVLGMTLFVFLAERNNGIVHQVLSPLLGSHMQNTVVGEPEEGISLDAEAVVKPAEPVPALSKSAEREYRAPTVDADARMVFPGFAPKPAPIVGQEVASFKSIEDAQRLEEALPPVYFAPAVSNAPSEAKVEIYDYELPDLIYSFAFAYENGDLEQFVGLFSNDATADDVQGKVRISKNYRDFFQATDMRDMDIKEVAWQPEGEKAKGSGAFEVTVWRTGNVAPSIVKGKIDIEVVKDQERLYIKKLSMATEQR
ncbi:AAA family ATPase [Pseudomonadota bacterium]